MQMFVDDRVMSSLFESKANQHRIIRFSPRVMKERKVPALSSNRLSFWDVKAGACNAADNIQYMTQTKCRS